MLAPEGSRQQAAAQLLAVCTLSVTILVWQALHKAGHMGAGQGLPQPAQAHGQCACSHAMELVKLWKELPAEQQECCLSDPWAGHLLPEEERCIGTARPWPGRFALYYMSFRRGHARLR